MSQNSIGDTPTSWRFRLYAITLSLAVTTLLFPKAVLRPARSIYFQGLDGTDGVFGDASLGLWTVWKNSVNGLSSVNYLNSFPWGERGFSIADASQALFFGPITLFSKVTSPVLAWNLGIVFFLVLGSYATWWASVQLCRDETWSLIAIPLVSSCQFLVWTVGGATALVAYWPIPLLIGTLASTQTFTFKRLSTLVLIIVAGSLSDPFIALSCILLVSVWAASRWLPVLLARTPTRAIVSCAGLLTIVLLFGRIAQRVSNSWDRSYDEWQAFGARWWMFLPSRTTPIVGSFFGRAQDALSSGEIILSRPASQTIGLGVCLTGFFVWSLLSRKRTARIRPSNDSKTERRNDQFVVQTAFVSFILMIVPSHQSNFEWAYPSRGLYEIFSIWRYTGRLTIVFHVCVVCLVVSQAACFFDTIRPNQQSRSKTLRFAAVLLIATIPLLETLSVIRKVEDRAFALSEVPEVYRYLSARPGSAYVDLPGFGSSPFPSNIFQYVSNNAVMDRGSSPLNDSKNIPVDDIVLSLESACSPQTLLAITTLGLRFVVYRTDDEESVLRLTQCGWILTKRFESEPEVRFGVFKWPRFQFLLTPPIHDRNLAAVVLPEHADWTVNWTLDMNYSWTQRSDQAARVRLVWLPRNTKDDYATFRLNGSFLGQTVFECSGEDKRYLLRATVNNGTAEMNVPRWCTTIKIQSGRDSLVVDSAMVTLRS